MAKELNVAARKRNKTTIVGLKNATGTRQVTIEDFDPYSFARAIATRQEARSGTAKQRLIAKVQADLKRRGISV